MTGQEAIEIAARCWCAPQTSGIEMDVRLAEIVAAEILDAHRRGVAERDEKIAAFSVDAGAVLSSALAERDAEIARWAKSLGDCHKALAEARRREREVVIARLKEALNGACECGGHGPDDCCLACEVWHRFRALGDEP